MGNRTFFMGKMPVPPLRIPVSQLLEPKEMWKPLDGGRHLCV
jgi:hypothetical protein